MVHRLTRNRLFMLTLAASMLLAFMPWQGAFHCQGDTATAGPGGPCCCCVAESAATGGSSCCTPADPDPEDPDGCTCIQVGKAEGLPPVIVPDDREQTSMPLHPAGDTVAAEATVALPVRLHRPPARNGPLLHLRLQILLI